MCEKNRSNLSQGKVLIKLDIVNAFNCVSRIAMRQAVAEDCPRLITFFYFCFHDTTKIFFKDVTPIVEASSGTIQGNGISSSIFDLAKRSVDKKTLSQCPGVDINSIQDDTFLYGTPDNCNTFFVKHEENLRNIGLSLKKSDCKVVSGSIDVDSLPSEIERVRYLKALGVPIGDDDFVNEFLEHKKINLIKLVNDVEEYLHGHADHAFHLLRSSINSIGSYIGRIILPSQLQRFATDFDNIINRSIDFLLEFINACRGSNLC